MTDALPSSMEQIGTLRPGLTPEDRAAIAVVASATEFANPWHDELGRFAPKGYQRRGDSLPAAEVTVFVEPENPFTGFHGDDFRRVEDPDERATAMLQWHMDTSISVKQAAVNMSEGVDPLEGVDAPDVYGEYPFHEASYGPDDYAVDVLRSAEWLLAQPSATVPELHRGMRVGDVDDFGGPGPAELFPVGQPIDLSLTSFTTDRQEAKIYTTRNPDMRQGRIGVMMLLRDAPAVDLSEHRSGPMRGSDEHLVSGKAEVSAIYREMRPLTIGFDDDPVTGKPVSIIEDRPIGPWVIEVAMVPDIEDDLVATGASLDAQRRAALNQPQHRYDKNGFVVPEPLVATIGQFANPWHDELGRFAPKGYGSNRPVREVTRRDLGIEGLPGPDIFPAQFAVTTANGSMIKIGGRTDLLTDRQISEALNAAADAHDIVPAHAMTPVIWVYENHVEGARGGGLEDDRFDEKTYGWVSRNDPFLINLNGDQNFLRPMKQSGWSMPSSRYADKIRYAVTHEMGHAHHFLNFSTDEMKAKMPREVATLSRYGRTNVFEAYAESFAEYVGTAGSTTNTFALATAAEFGWEDQILDTMIDVEDQLAAAGGPDDEPMVVADSEDGPIHIYADGRAVRFAPTDERGW